MRYYDGYKVLGEQYTAQGLDPQLLLQNIAIQEQIQQQAVQYAQAALTAYMAQFVTVTPSSATTVQSAQSSPVDQTVAQTAVHQTVVPATVVESAAPVAKAVNPLLTLAHYGGDSDEENDDCNDGEENKENDKVAENESTSHSTINETKSEAYLIPPEDVSVIIEKMAAYVSKNGADFENIVRSRGDPRFEFLKPEHDFHSYYRLKLKGYLGPSTQDNDKDSGKDLNQNTPSDSKKQNGSTTTKDNDIVAISTEKKLPVPVSFSIKIREEPQIEIKPSALPIEESSDEEENDTATNNDNQKQLDVSVNVKNDIDSSQTVKSNNSCIRKSTPSRDYVPKANVLNSTSLGNAVVPSVNRNRTLVDSKSSKSGVIDVTESDKKNDDGKKRGEKEGGEFNHDDPLLEMIDLTDDLDDKTDDSTKQTILTHDQQQRALQQERRRKAAAFLRLRSIMEQQGKTIDNHIDIRGTATDAHDTMTMVSGTIKRKGTSSGRESTEGAAKEERAQSMSSDVVEIIDDSDDEGEKETKRSSKEKKKSSKKKKSHKRKHSKASRSPREGSSSSSSRRKNKKRTKVSSITDKSRSKVRASRSRTRSTSRSS